MSLATTENRACGCPRHMTGHLATCPERSIYQPAPMGAENPFAMWLAEYEREYLEPYDTPALIKEGAVLMEAALRVVTNAYGTNPRHTRKTTGECRDDCIPCGLAALTAVVHVMTRDRRDE